MGYGSSPPEKIKLFCLSVVDTVFYGSQVYNHLYGLSRQRQKNNRTTLLSFIRPFEGRKKHCFIPDYSKRIMIVRLDSGTRDYNNKVHSASFDQRPQDPRFNTLLN